jgi:D-alanyl-D-alanine carboxypeptidase
MPREADMPKNTRTWDVVVLLVAVALSAAAQDHGLDDLLRAYEEEGTFSGSIAACRGGEILLERSCGWRDTDATARNDAKSVYYIGSVSKVFVAALVLKAVDEGDLALDDPIHRFVPSFEAGEGVTVSNLLNHSSGLPEWLGRWDTSRKTDIDLEDFFVFISGQSSDFPAGTRSAYSNSNYEMLAYILEGIYRRPYAEILEDGILGPLGLEHSGFGLPASCDGPLARNWLEYTLLRLVGPWKGACIPSGSLFSSVGDLKIFFSALSGGRIIPRESFALMHAATIAEGAESVGYGFWTKADGSFYKTGSIAGYKALMYRVPDLDVDIFILASKWMPISGASMADEIVPAILAELAGG